MTDVVNLEIEDGVAWIRMNRPKALNALDTSLTRALIETTQQVADDPAVRCVVLGSTSEHFMAGGDLKEFSTILDKEPAERRRIFADFIHRMHPLVLTVRGMDKPVIASVRGAVAGFGMSFMMAADLAIAADDSYFTLAYILIGTSPDGGSTFALPRIVGVRKAMEIAMLGDRFDAAKAHALGLVNWVVPGAELDAETAKLAGRLAKGPTGALGRTKKLLQASLDNPLERQLQMELECFSESASVGDFKEGVTAFVGKRKPEFTGG